MTHVFKSLFSRTTAVLGLLGLGLAQVGCAHPVPVDSAVVVHSRMGHGSVYAQVALAGSTLYPPVPRVIYVPAPPPRVVFLPPVVYPSHDGGRSQDRHRRYQERRHPWTDGPPGARGGPRERSERWHRDGWQH